MIRLFARRLVVIAAVHSLASIHTASAADANAPELRALYSNKVQPLLATYCHSCHGKNEPQGKLDLTLFASIDRVADGHEAWQAILERLEAKEMPPDDAKRQPTDTERQTLIDWIRAFHADQVTRNAGDPGVVPARRLNAAEYNYTIRDLIGFDIQPAKQFPIDPANEAGFDNSSQSLTMSPGLAKKYVEAARFVAEHLVLKPESFDFAPHPAMTDTDRDKYCVNRIVDFYRRQPTDLAAYFLAAWKFKHRAALGNAETTLAEIAAAEDVSPKYLGTLWSVLAEESFDVGPMAKLKKMWSELPAPTPTAGSKLAPGEPPSDLELRIPGASLLPANEMEKMRASCIAIRDWVKSLRRKLEPSVKGLKVPGVHEGSQSFVLWKNRQYAANRRTYSKAALQISTTDKPAEVPDLAVPTDEAEHARYEASFSRFCDIFPDAFYISERGRDYVGKAREQQEKGRLLSAGFHSQMGYFRDDRPLCDLVLGEGKKAELDKLWQELDFIANVPLRQLQGFLWFERTDSRFMRDPEFDPFRAEDKNATSGDKIARLAEVYLAKARANDGDEVELQAITDYFREMDERSRWVEQARLTAESSHLQRLLAYAHLAYRRPLLKSESDDLLAFYRSLRAGGDVTHEEAIQDTLVYILMSPQFCYRMDLSSRGVGFQPAILARSASEGLPSNQRPRPLDNYELASRLSYFLWSSMPDAELLNHAAASDLHEPKILTAQVRRMLADDRSRALAVEFGGNWLDFRRFEQHNSVDRTRFPTFTNELRQAMYEEPIRFFVDLIQRDGSVLDFLYAKHTFVNGTLAEHYDLPDSLLGKDEWVRINDAVEHGRGGLLPMAVFLTQNAPGLRTSPVKRGYWVVRRILGERIPAPPPNVPELPADESKLELPLRETLAKHRDHAACAGCHERFDSLGLVFEGYGPIGERRHTDLAGRPIDTSSTFPHPTPSAGSKPAPGAPPDNSAIRTSEQPSENKAQKSATAVDRLQTYLHTHREQEFLENLSRKLLSYALGRTLLPSDDPLVAQMRQNLAANDHRFTSLIETIVTSQQFLTKRN